MNTNHDLPEQKTPAPEVLLTLGSDLHLRMKWFSPQSFAHPAKLHLGLVEWLVQRYTRPGDTIADPMTGIGSTLLAAASQRHVIAREVEPKWLELLEENARRIREQAGLFTGVIDVGQGDALQPWGYTADHLLFSPPYGCEASSSPNARRSLPYRIRPEYNDRWYRLVKCPTPGSVAANMFHYGTHAAQVGHFRGPRYWRAMEQVYSHAYNALRPGGLMMLIVKDHIKDGKRVQTADQTVALCQRLGFVLYERASRRVFPLSLWQRRRKEAGLPVVEDEDILILRSVQP